MAHLRRLMHRQLQAKRHLETRHSRPGCRSPGATIAARRSPVGTLARIDRTIAGVAIRPAYAGAQTRPFTRLKLAFGRRRRLTIRSSKMDLYRHHVSGFFTQRSTAEQALAQLIQRGMHHEQLEIVAGNADAPPAPAPQGKSNKEIGRASCRERV